MTEIRKGTQSWSIVFSYIEITLCCSLQLLGYLTPKHNNVTGRVYRVRCLTTDMIFTLRHLQEKCREQDNPPYVACYSSLRPVYTGDFCRSNSMQLNAIFLVLKLQPAAISLRF